MFSVSKTTALAFVVVVASAQRRCCDQRARSDHRDELDREAGKNVSVSPTSGPARRE